MISNAFVILVEILVMTIGIRQALFGKIIIGGSKEELNGYGGNILTFFVIDQWRDPGVEPE